MVRKRKGVWGGGGGGEGGEKGCDACLQKQQYIKDMSIYICIHTHMHTHMVAHTYPPPSPHRELYYRYWCSNRASTVRRSAGNVLVEYRVVQRESLMQTLACAVVQ